MAGNTREMLKQPPRGVLKKRCSEKMQQIYRKTPHADVRFRSFFGPCFPAFGLNTERYGVISCIWTEYSGIRIWENTDQKNSEYGHFSLFTQWELLRNSIFFVKTVWAHSDFSTFLSKSRVLSWSIMQIKVKDEHKYQKQPSEVFIKSSQILQENVCVSVFCNFNKKRLQHRCFPVRFAKFLRTLILNNSCERLVLKYTTNHNRNVIWKSEILMANLTSQNFLCWHIWWPRLK